MGFNITEIVESKGWKKFMAKLYGWGASVVIVGALFKIMHWPGSGLFLTLGLLTEAVIFFFSAFEPLHEEIDWTLVYPELAGMHEEELLDTDTHKKDTNKKSALERFEELVGTADLTPDIFQKLGQGFKTLSDTTSKISDISNATVATQEYIGNIKTASSSFSNLNDSYSKSVNELNQNASQLSNSYSKAADMISSSGSNLANVVNNVGSSIAEKVANSGNELASKIQEAGAQIQGTYKKLAESLQSGSSSVVENNKSYAEQLEYITKNLSALNAVYELQLKGTNEQMKATEQLYGGVNEMMKNLKESVEDTKKYRDEVSKLGQNLAALNTIYGNMLSAMNFNKVNS